jgi:hypothetical protein
MPGFIRLDYNKLANNLADPLTKLLQFVVDYDKVNVVFKYVNPVSIAAGSRAVRLNQVLFTPTTDILVLGTHRWLGHPKGIIHEGHFWLHTGTWSSWLNPLDLKLILLEADSHHHDESAESRDYVVREWYPIPIKIPANTPIYWSSDFSNLSSSSSIAFDEIIEVIYMQL